MPPNDRDQQALAIDFAWRTHDSIQQWTRNVDQKSSIVLAFVTAVGALLAREALSADGGLAEATGVHLWLVRMPRPAFSEPHSVLSQRSSRSCALGT
jgi:hypothetical protein